LRSEYRARDRPVRKAFQRRGSARYRNVEGLTFERWVVCNSAEEGHRATLRGKEEIRRLREKVFVL